MNKTTALFRCMCSVHTEVEAKGKSDRLSEDQLSAIVNKAELVKITDRYRPSGTWAFWYPQPDMDKTELETGQEIRLKTRGDSPFICESFTVKQKNVYVQNSIYFCCIGFFFLGKIDAILVSESSFEGEVLKVLVFPCTIFWPV